MLRFQESSNKRISNLATVFLQDYCTEAQKKQAIESKTEWQQQAQAQTQA